MSQGQLLEQFGVGHVPVEHRHPSGLPLLQGLRIEVNTHDVHAPLQESFGQTAPIVAQPDENGVDGSGWIERVA